MSYFFLVQLFLIWSLNISTQIIANPSSAQWSNVIQFFRYPAALLVYFIGTYFIMSLVSILNIFVVPGKHFLPYSDISHWILYISSLGRLLILLHQEVVDTSTSRGCLIISSMILFYFACNSVTTVKIGHMRISATWRYGWGYHPCEDTIWSYQPREDEDLFLWYYCSQTFELDELQTSKEVILVRHKICCTRCNYCIQNMYAC